MNEPEPTCGASFQTRTGHVHTCTKPARYRFTAHIHRDQQVRFVSLWILGHPIGTYYRPLRKRCPECGQKKTDITTSLDPYAQDIDGTSVPMTACGDCFTRRTQEI